MSLLVFQHVRQETASVLGRMLMQYGHRLRVIELDAGHPMPADLDDVDGIVSLGGPMNVDEVDQHPWLPAEMALIRASHQQQLPVIGICLGAQLIAAALGGKVAPMPKPEVGFGPIKLSFPGSTDPIFAGLRSQHTQFHLHSQEVTALPPGAVALAGSPACKNQAFRVGLTTYAFQFHFEWNRQDLAAMAQLPIVAQAGHSAQTVQDSLEHHYDEYRRLGDRLCVNLAQYLMPVDKNVAS